LADENVIALSIACKSSTHMRGTKMMRTTSQHRRAK